MKEINAVLPYPHGISVNKVWKCRKSGLYLNPKVIDFRNEVYILLYKNQGLGKSKIDLSIKMYPPDHRKRDIDNILKVILDALTYARMYNDDSQICKLYVEKCEVIKNGKIEISIKSME